MNLIENVREGLNSIAGNRLRTVLTSAIIAIGITSLVGILTAIDGIQSSLNSSFEGLGANTFSILVEQQRGRFGGRMQRADEPITFRQAVLFKRRFPYGATISVSSLVSGATQVKYGSRKTNPNVQLYGIDDTFLTVKNYKLASGRNLNANDVENSLNVTIIGSELAGALFGANVNPLNQIIRAQGAPFKVIGVLEKKGSLTGGGDDRVMLIPIDNARVLAGERALTFDITASVPDISDQETAVGEARGTMRLIRRDALGQPDSFRIERADELAKDLDETTGVLRIGGFVVGFITLLGAAIALMNIMLVSVTERTREIGIRKSLGATPQLIRMQFLIEAIVICVLGGIGGVVLGLGIGNLISLVVSQGEGAFVVPWGWMMLGILICVAVGLFSGIYPAIRASRLDPIEALRYE
ncbi:FtsX-like permease family protein [Rudanella paleaurantiibacter]|uniref:FtsX-like permease family protein n=1 Tax=Rudanella paleaurantiibacter TaxID=2614655 RepID=A0A7J5U2A8_9BACT|nr:ABC transporter permease [Rudanella paleaurantiibacter]KAB7731094.1 FtsX-like permease family protein [Rudanella paleaurantiibacter]